MAVHLSPLVILMLIVAVFIVLCSNNVENYCFVPKFIEVVEGTGS